MSKIETVKAQCRQLKMSAITNTISEVVMMAEKKKLTYLEFINQLFNNEINQRMENDKKRRVKQARLPLVYNLDLFDFSLDNGISEQELKQLRELKWLEQNFNIEVYK